LSWSSQRTHLLSHHLSHQEQKPIIHQRPLIMTSSEQAAQNRLWQQETEQIVIAKPPMLYGAPKQIQRGKVFTCERQLYRSVAVYTPCWKDEYKCINLRGATNPRVALFFKRFTLWNAEKEPSEIWTGDTTNGPAYSFVIEIVQSRQSDTSRMYWIEDSEQYCFLQVPAPFPTRLN
jgi:hypothetical protein